MTSIVAGLLLGAVFGVAARLGRFCLLRGLKPVRLGGERAALGAFALAMVVALVGTQSLLLSGQIDLTDAVPLSAAPTWLGLVAGGLIFGLGMALANACGARSLVLLAGGNLRSLVVLLCLGLSAQATQTGALAPLRLGIQALGASVAAPVQGALPQALAEAGLGGNAALALAIGLPAVLLIVLALPPLRRAPREAMAAVVVGACVAGGWWISTASGDPFDPRPPVSLSFIGPIGESLLWTMQSTAREAGFPIAVVAGTLAGAFLTALATRDLRLEGFGSARHLARAAFGGVLMGFGGVLALGCSIGQGLSGFSTLSLGSLIALAAIVVGTFAGLALSPPATTARAGR